MKAISCREPGHFQFLDVPEPVAAEGEVMLRIRRIGICGTDFHAFAGEQPYFEYPRILGHELSAEVAESSGEFNAGDTVVPVPYIHCGVCPTCLGGKTNCCPSIRTLGVHIDGGMRELMPVPAKNLMRADDLSHEQVATVECLAIGAHAVRRANLEQGQWIAVAGTGPIGIGVLHFARLAKARTIAIDVNPDRLEYCRNIIGVDACVDARGETVDQLREITEGNLPQKVFDATGVPAAMEAAFEYVGHGGALILVSIVKGSISFADPLLHAREMTIMSSRNATRSDFSLVMDSLRDGKIDISTFVTHRCQFDEIAEKFEHWGNPSTGVVKGMVEL
ncbi:MAG: zinc-binding alcohol dehydrogenase family protein [Verrucomicrobiota bacterium]|nr:zinc-binding alcohol dehydrogenase family protein [Verrucomicrobiota bacterium]